MGHRCDAVVIGAGPGGYVCAIKLAKLGKKVMLVEKADLGGVCLNVGCIPSKALIHIADVVTELRDASKLGLDVSVEGIDGKGIQKWKKRIVRRLTGGVKMLCESNGVEILMGSARFTGPKTIEVDTGGETETVEADAFVVATGSRTIELPGLPFSDDRIVGSTGALAFEEIPDSLTVVGGGYIGLELGICYAKLGSDVTVVELLPQLLSGTDPEAVSVVEKTLKRLKVRVELEARAGKADTSGDKVKLPVTRGDESFTVEADRVLVTVGRKPNSADLGLEEVGVELDDGGHIVIDRACRTSADGIYAIGDVAGGPKLAHKASKEGIVAAEVIAGKRSVKDWAALPWAVFTDPEIAGAGLSEEEAREEGFDPVVGKFPFSALGRAQTIGHREGFVKLISDRDTDRLLGGIVCGPHASDLISEITLGIEMGAVTEDLALTIHPHPTFPEAIMEAAEAMHGQAIHIPE